MTNVDDMWASWLGKGRDGGSSAVRQAALRSLERVRDEVLTSAGLADGQRLLDVGTGDGEPPGL